MANTDLTIVGKIGDFFHSLLRKPGDHVDIHAEVSKTGRQVIKVSGNNDVKYSATKYPSTGTIVETRVTKPKK